jgi:CRP-like cAMP-binding protein/tetratricopeptide (TPR) repeat protein
MQPLKGNTENYRNGETIFEEGEMGAEVFILIEGRVELIKRGKSSSIEIEVLEPGATFGEMAALDSQPRSLTARALGDVVVEVVEQEAFLDALHRDPEFAREIMTGLTTGIRTLHDMLAGNLEFKTIAAPVEETESETIERTENEIFALLKRVFGRGRADETAGELSDVLATDDRPDAASAAAGEGSGSPATIPVETEEMAIAAQDLFQTWQATQEPVVVLVANFANDAGGSAANEVSAAIDGQQALMARRIEKLLEHDDQGDIERQLAGAAQRGREWLAEENASVLVWGEITHEGSVISLRFIPSLGSGETTPGGYSLVTKLDLPREFTIQAAELLCASVICALGPKSQAQRERLMALVPPRLEEARRAGLIPSAQLPEPVTMSALTCYGNALAIIGHQEEDLHWYEEASEAYRAAIAVAVHYETPFDVAVTRRHLAIVLDSLSERLETIDLLEEAQNECNAALEVFTDTQYRWNWAVTQNCLGKILFKQGVATAETAKFKDAIVAFQSALKVFARKVAPERWAEVINNIGTVLQFFGARTKREDVLTAATNIFRTAANARSREDAPILWATSHNNLGTSLFFLAKESPKMEVLDEATQTFQHALSVFKAFGSARMAGLAVGNITRLEAHKKALLGVETAGESSAIESLVDDESNEPIDDDSSADDTSDSGPEAVTSDETGGKDQTASAAVD